MRPSSLGGGRILRRTLSVRLSVCPSVRPVMVTERHVAPPSELQWHTWHMSHMFFSAEGRISYGHLGRTNSCCIVTTSPVLNLTRLIFIHRLQFFSSSVSIQRWVVIRYCWIEWHGSAMISRIVWEFVEGFLERISRLLGSGGGRKSVTICHCPWEKREFIGISRISRCR